MLDFVLDRRADVPLGVQLAWAIRARIGDGRFAAGSRLPGLRDLAEALDVNVNTIRAVYRRLEHEGLIESRQGSGTFVAPTAPTQAAANVIAAEAATHARQTGIDPRDVAAALYVGEDAGRAVDADPEAQRRARLRSQIAALEQTLAELEAEHPGLAPERRAGDAGDGGAPRLPDASELEQARLRLLRRLTAMQAAIDAIEKAEDDGGGDEDGGRAAPRASGAARRAMPLGGASKRKAPRTSRPATAGA